MNDSFYPEDTGYFTDHNRKKILAWKEIYTQRFLNNLDLIRELVGSEKKIIIPIKANAYGHSIFGIASLVQGYLIDSGLRIPQYSDKIYEFDSPLWLGVANFNEALMLREKGIQLPILNFGALFPHFAQEYLHNQIYPSLSTLTHLDFWLNEFKDSGQSNFFHLKFDTGMGRLGIPMHEVEQAFDLLRKRDIKQIEGVYSHLATADVIDDEHTINQINNFQKIRQMFRDEGIDVRNWHLANSGGIFNYPESYFDMVRPGIALYGYYPSAETKHKFIREKKSAKSLLPVMEVKARVSAAKDLPPGHGVSYGRLFVTPEKMKTAIVPIGYGDGFPRILSNQWHVLYQGKKYPVLGTVSMDQIVIASSEDGPLENDVVTLLGGDEQNDLWADAWAQKLDTISYEILCQFTSRIPFVYV